MKMRRLKLVALVMTLAMVISTASAFACTGAYVGKDVSEDGTTIIARSEDQGTGAFDLADCGNQKPAQVRFVINCIALESTAQALACAKKYGCGAPEVTQISVARGHAVGNYTMMKSENPITIICFDAENPINR